MDTLTLNIRDRKLDPIPFVIAPALHDQWQWWLQVYPFRIDRIFWIVDATVNQLHSKILEYYQENTEKTDLVVLFPAGEPYKSRRFRDILEDVLLNARINRHVLIVIVGGGTLGDLAGFVAATIHRGIRYVFFPTTLLAQVDSCLGGKVGINHPQGKNLLGAFHYPTAVFIRTRFLRTLPWAEWVNGLAEVIKYALLFDVQLLTVLKKYYREIRARDSVWVQRIIRRSLHWKKWVVEHDPDERWYRSSLNFGHTVGHALERYFDYTISHGAAILVGMAVELLLSQRLCSCPGYLLKELQTLLERYPEPSVLQLLNADPDELWRWMQHDKKSDDEVRCSLLHTIGDPCLYEPVSQSEFLYAWESLQNLPLVLDQFDPQSADLSRD